MTCIVDKKGTERATHTPRDKRVSLRTCFWGWATHKELSRKGAFRRGHISGKNTGPKICCIFVLNMDEFRGPTSFSRCVCRPFLVFAGLGSGLRCGCSGVFRAREPVVLQQHKLEGEGREGRKRTSEERKNTKNTYPGSVKFRFFCDCLNHFLPSIRAWRTRAWLPDASGCFSTS